MPRLMKFGDGYRQVPSASEMFRKEYGSSKNFMTPRILSRGMLARGREGQAAAYELSEGTGIDHEPIFGVTVVRMWADGTTERWYDKSHMFHSRQEAETYIAKLKSEVRAMINQFNH